jgi:hypothetical protein
VAGLRGRRNTLCARVARPAWSYDPSTSPLGSGVLTHSESVHLRYILLLNAVAALAPTSILKGRENDPLRHASWWTLGQHSAVLVVSAAAVLGTALVYLLLRRNLRRWWMFLLAGSFTSMLPGLFYLVAAPLDDRMLGAVLAMITIAVVWGALIGLVIYAISRTTSRAPDPNNRSSGRET